MGCKMFCVIVLYFTVGDLCLWGTIETYQSCVSLGIYLHSWIYCVWILGHVKTVNLMSALYLEMAHAFCFLFCFTEMKFVTSDIVFGFSWDQVVAAFWKRYPNPFRFA